MNVHRYLLLLTVVWSVHARTPTAQDIDAYYEYVRTKKTGSRVMIFIEQPARVYEMSKLLNEPLSTEERFEMKLRISEALAFRLFTFDTSCHAGLLIRDNECLYQIHADIYITKKNMAKKKHLFAGYDLYEPDLTPEQQDALIKNMQQYVRECHYADISGVLSTWLQRERSYAERHDPGYARHYYDRKEQIVTEDGRLTKKFICTEWVAVAFASIGIDLAPRYRFNKLYMLDLVQGGTLNFNKITFDDWFSAQLNA